MRSSIISRSLITLAVLAAAMASLVTLWHRYTPRVTAQSAPACVTPPSGMVAWWPGDGNANDIQGGNNGTLQNGATFATGKVGQAFSFDGVNDFASFGTSVSNFGTADFTVDFWIKTTSTRAEGMMGKRPVCNHSSFWYMDLTNGRPELAVDQDAAATNYDGVISTTPVNNGVFHHVAATRQGTLLSIYIDGVLDATRTTPGIANIVNTADFVAGKTACSGIATQFFTGILDELEIFNRALSASEIQAIASAGSAGKCRTCTPPPSAMTGWWPGDGNANDIQGGNNGTLQNGATFAAGMVGQAFSLDGVNDFVAVPHNSNLNPTSAISIDAWVFINGYTFYPAIVNKGNVGTYAESYALYAAPDGSLGFLLNRNGTSGGRTELFGPMIPLNTWTHVAGTYDGATMRIYINGILVGSAAHAGGILVTPDSVLIGKSDRAGSSFPTSFFSGRIDEVEIFNRALTETEIQAIVHADSAGKCKNNRPVAVCQNVPVSAGANCTASASIDNGSSDPDSDAITLSQSPAGPYSLGNTTVTLTVTDSKGASSTCSAIVTVVDTTLPLITAPANASYQCLSQVPPGNPSQATATDNCSTPTITVADASNGGAGSTASPLVITRVFTAKDAANNSTSAPQTITVIDSTPPTIAAPPAVNVSIGPSATACGTVVSDAALGSATASDNCGSATVTRSGVPAGNLFPVGTTTITYTANDGHGNTATATQTVTVSDNTPPTITAPPTVNASTGAGATACSVVISDATLGAATANDNCSVTVARSGAPAGNVFPVGTTTITYTATDGSGNTATATQQVIVADNTSPIIVAPPAVNASTGAGATACGTVVSDAALGAATASDNCGTANITRSGVPAGNLFPVGTTTITYTANDGHGNTATSTQTVTVVDNTPPAISCPAGTTVAANAGCQAAVPNVLGNVTASDNCTAAGSLMKSQSPAAGTLVGPGATTITVTVSDGAGNSSTCATSFTVVDATPPALTLNGANPITIECHSGFTDQGATASDACAGNLTNAIAVSGAVNANAVGSYTLTYSVSDGVNTTTRTRTVNVVDTTAPEITVPRVVYGATGPGATSCGVVVSDAALGPATANDACAGAVAVTRSGVPAGNFFPVGTTTITYAASDGNGNTATLTQDVIVSDNTAPTLSIPSGTNLSVGASCQVTLPNLLASLTASDNCTPAASLMKTQSPAAGTMVGLGVVPVTVTVTDAAGNSTTSATSFNVIDNTSPTITAPPNVNAYTGAAATTCGVVVSDAALGNATASDNCSVTVTRSGVPAGNFFPVGATMITYTARDASSNTTTATQLVTVVDNTPPVIACPANVSVANNVATTVNPGVATATDNCAGVSVAGVRSDGQPINAAYPLGVTTITWTATDAAGNHASCQQTVTVTASALTATITGPPTGSVYAVGTPVTFTGSFTDNAARTHTATWKFDSLTSAGTVNEATGGITGSYAFTAAGVYKVSLTVTGSGGATSTTDVIGPDGLSELVVIYDPNGGWVTGGGWINSPAGAYVPNPSLTGKANFGFVSKYQNGNSVPTGNTEFQFKAGNLNFSSTVYEWMVISGARAQYKGSGTINGAGDYRFMLTAIDGQEPGGGGTDKFRIRIWNNNGGGLVYDNQMNAPDSADPTTTLGGGSIVIHR